MQPFIDTHVHCWDRTQVPYPWLDGFPSIAGRHTPAELRAEVGRRAFPSKILVVEGDCDRARAFDEVRAIEALAADRAGNRRHRRVRADGPRRRDHRGARSLARAPAGARRAPPDPGRGRSRLLPPPGVHRRRARGRRARPVVRHLRQAPPAGVGGRPGERVSGHAVHPRPRGQARHPRAPARTLARADRDARLVAPRRVQAVGPGDRGGSGGVDHRRSAPLRRAPARALRRGAPDLRQRLAGGEAGVVVPALARHGARAAVAPRRPTIASAILSANAQRIYRLS